MTIANIAALTGWTPKSGTVRGGGYLDPIITGGVGWGIGANTSRYYLSANNESRIWMTGNLTAVRLYVGTKHADITAFYVSVWRKNASGTYDRIGQEDIWSSLAASSLTTVTLATPIAVVQGDYIGYGITASSTAGGYQTLGVADQAAASTYFVNGATPDETGYAWETKLASAVLLPVVAYLSVAPSAVCIGGSLIAGHPANYSFAENSKTVDATSDVSSLLQNMLGVTNIVNMGIGGQTTTTIAARIAADLADFKPRWAVLDGGTNDLIAGTVSEATFIANWTTTLNACEAAGVVPICVPILPWTNGTNEQMQTRDTWNASLETLVLSYPEALYASDALAMLGQFRTGGDAGNLWDIIAAYSADGIHLTAAGYAVLAQAIVRAIARGRTASQVSVDALPTYADVQAAAQAAIVAEPATLTAAYDAAKTALAAADYTAPPTDYATAVALAAAKAVVDAIADAIAALPGAQVGTRIDDTSVDSDGNVLGIATAGSTITAYLASDTDRSDPVRQTTAATDGTWALYLPDGAYTLVVTLDGYYDAAEGDSEITRTVVVG